jgi:prepilin-type N-terminal cleavage/methylation domain-containing protein
MSISQNRSRSSGFTLVELTISSVILAVVGYSVSVAVKLGNDSNSTVMRVTGESRSERKTMAALMDDVRMSSNARITVATDADGNSLVQIQQPIEVGGVFVWGARDRRLGDDDDAWNRQDWTIRYLVDGNAQLVRRVVDANGVTQLEDVLGDDLLDEGGTPGFRMVQSGDVWQVNLAVHRGAHSEAIAENEFHVRTRN